MWLNQTDIIYMLISNSTVQPFNIKAFTNFSNNLFENKNRFLYLLIKKNREILIIL